MTIIKFIIETFKSDEDFIKLHISSKSLNLYTIFSFSIYDFFLTFNSGTGSFSSSTVDLNTPGIKEVKVTYEGFSAYFTVLVGYSATDAATIRNSRNEANAPEYLTGMIPVRWYEKGGYWITTTLDDADWYNYTDQLNPVWANVMLRDGLKLQDVPDVNDYTELNFLAGKRVLDEGSSFVWIPRYTYKDLNKSYLYICSKILLNLFKKRK